MDIKRQILEDGNKTEISKLENFRKEIEVTIIEALAKDSHELGRIAFTYSPHHQINEEQFKLLVLYARQLANKYDRLKVDYCYHDTTTKDYILTFAFGPNTKNEIQPTKNVKHKEYKSVKNQVIDEFRDFIINSNNDSKSFYQNKAIIPHSEITKDEFDDLLSRIGVLASEINNNSNSVWFIKVAGLNNLHELTYGIDVEMVLKSSL